MSDLSAIVFDRPPHELSFQQRAQALRILGRQCKGKDTPPEISKRIEAIFRSIVDDARAGRGPSPAELISPEQRAAICRPDAGEAPPELREKIEGMTTAQITARLLALRDPAGDVMLRIPSMSEAELRKLAADPE